MSILGYWKFEGNLNDSSGNGHTLAGTVAYTTGLINGGQAYDCTDDSVNNSDASFNVAQGTINNWVKTTETRTGRHPVAMSYGLAGNIVADGGYLCSYDWPVGQIPAFPVDATNSVFVSDGTWKMLTFTYSRTAGRYAGYVNGELAFSGASYGSNGYTDVQVGETGGEAFTGVIDDVFISDVEYGAGQVKDIYSYNKGFFS